MIFETRRFDTFINNIHIFDLIDINKKAFPSLNEFENSLYYKPHTFYCKIKFNILYTEFFQYIITLDSKINFLIIYTELNKLGQEKLTSIIISLSDSAEKESIKFEMNAKFNQEFLFILMHEANLLKKILKYVNTDLNKNYHIFLNTRHYNIFLYSLNNYTDFLILKKYKEIKILSDVNKIKTIHKFFINNDDILKINKIKLLGNDIPEDLYKLVVNLENKFKIISA